MVRYQSCAPSKPPPCIEVFRNNSLGKYWSPDGSKIWFSRDNRLWEMSSDGTGLHPLLPGAQGVIFAR
jgi:Tol biopolymer transport system component